jgi:hypothetical protein
MLILREEYSDLLNEIYNEKSVDSFIQNYSAKLIEKLLVDQVDQNKSEIMQIKRFRNENNVVKVRVNSSSSYFIQNE